MKYNTNIFIEKSNQKHNNKFDYSHNLFVNSQTKVKIICPIHGEFKQTPAMHLLRNGCPKCGNISNSNSKKKNLDWFIKKANIVHNSKYDYSLVEYIGICDKVKIICPIHGEFEQIPNSHLSGRGCILCGEINRRINNTKSKESFIEKSVKIYNNKYDYSLVNYINRSNPVKIICPIHGEFEQTPKTHLQQGCVKCGINLRIKKTTKTLESFLKRAKLVHGNKYDYSLFNYVRRKDSSIIICPIHGEFIQTACSHLLGHGCHRCGDESRGEMIIEKILINNGIKYIKQKRFKKCKNKKSLPFDFYLNENNILIEYDGKQHFEPIDFFGGVLSFNNTVENDMIKNKFVIENNIKLIRIKYIDINKIEEILKNEKVI